MEKSALGMTTKDILKIFNDSQIQAYQALWDGLMKFLSSNWLSVFLLFLFLFIFSLARAINGRWGMFGSMLYNYLYWGILFILGLIFGPKIFANLFIDIALFILYLICYALVGRILTVLHLKK